MLGAGAERSVGLRHARSALGTAGSVFCASLASGLLVLLLSYVTVQGITSLTPSFFLEIPRPVGVPGGGVGNGIAGSAIMIGIAAFIAGPLGVGTGIYLACFGRGFLAETVRYLSDVLSSIPSIAIGLFAYTILVAPLGHFSALSASVALAMLMLPIIVRATEEAFRSVPGEIREGALALGLTTFSTTLRVLLPAARPLLATGLLLAIARVSGETAPLLFTAFGSQFWQFNPLAPMAELSLQVFTYAISPYQEWHRLAWGGAFILIVVVFILNLAARAVIRPVAKSR
jgi:phosphate transport system permease protein